MILATSLLEIYLFDWALKLMEKVIWVVVCTGVFRAQFNILCQWRLLKNHWSTHEIWSNRQATMSPENLENTSNFEGLGLTIVA